MKRALIFSAFAGLLALAACSTRPAREAVPVTPIAGLHNVSVNFLVDNTRKLPLKGTFDWGYTLFRVANLPEFDLAAADQRLHNALAKTLTARGFVKTSANPDLLVSLALADGTGIDEKILNEAYEGAVLAPPTMAKDPDHALKYRRGTLIIDIVETRTKHLLCQRAVKTGQWRANENQPL